MERASYYSKKVIITKGTSKTEKFMGLESTYTQTSSSTRGNSNQEGETAKVFCLVCLITQITWVISSETQGMAKAFSVSRELRNTRGSSKTTKRMDLAS